MKKIYLAVFSMISTASLAQTLDQGDLPFAGLAWTSGVDTTYFAAIPPGGAAQSWNFSALQYNYVDTSGFGNAAGTPYAANFPGANLAAHKISTDEWTYFTSSSSGFYVNGFVSNTSPFVLNPPQMYVPVPFSFNDVHTNISRIVIDTTFLTYAAQAILNFQADFHADGYGSLTTPTGNYPSTLRVKETLLETDSLMVDYLGTGNYVLLGTQQSQRTFYRWYRHGGTANYLLGIDADSLGNNAIRSDYLMQWAVLGVNQVETRDGLTLFPNPANNVLNLNMDGAAIKCVELFNSTGSRVFLLAPAGFRSELKIDISNLSPGLYYYSLLAGERQIRGKVSIAR